VVTSLKAIGYYQQASYTSEIERLASSNPARAGRYRGELLDIEGLGHYIYQIPLQTGRWLLVSMQNEIIDDEFEDEGKDDSISGTLPSYEEYLMHPRRYKSMMADAQFKSQFKLFDDRDGVVETKKTRENICKHYGELRVCIAKSVVYCDPAFK
jgi:hypothetical protein